MFYLTLDYVCGIALFKKLVILSQNTFNYFWTDWAGRWCVQEEFIFVLFHYLPTLSHPSSYMWWENHIGTQRAVPWTEARQPIQEQNTAAMDKLYPG